MLLSSSLPLEEVLSLFQFTAPCPLRGGLNGVGVGPQMSCSTLPGERDFKVLALSCTLGSDIEFDSPINRLQGQGRSPQEAADGTAQLWLLTSLFKGSLYGLLCDAC